MQGVIALIESRPDQFRESFVSYLRANMFLWHEFREASFRVIRAGHKRYSARTIVEVLRYHSDIRDTSEYKITNQHIPDLARLFMLMYPAYSYLFRTKRSNVRRKFNEATKCKAEGKEVSTEDTISPDSGIGYP